MLSGAALCKLRIANFHSCMILVKLQVSCLEHHIQNIENKYERGKLLTDCNHHVSFIV